MPWRQPTILLLLVSPCLPVHPASALEPASFSHTPVCLNHGPLAWTSLVPRIPILSLRSSDFLCLWRGQYSCLPIPLDFMGYGHMGSYVNHISLWDRVRLCCPSDSPVQMLKNAHAQDILTPSVSPGGQRKVAIRHTDYGIRGTEFDFILALPLVTCVISGDVLILSLTLFPPIKQEWER